MRKLLVFFIFMVSVLTGAKADHITGGEMFYTFNGISGGLYQYSCTMKLYMRCNSGREFNNPTIISVFNRATGARIRDIEVPLGETQTIQITNPDPCISNPPRVCYEVGYFPFTLELPGLPEGYLIAGQVNFRIAGISNL